MSDTVSSEKIKVGYELSDFVSGTSTLVEGYERVALEIQNVADKSVILNNKQEALYITQKATIEGNLNSTITFKRYKESIEDVATGLTSVTYKYEPYRIALSGVTQAMKDQIAYEREFAQLLAQDNQAVTARKKAEQNQQVQDYKSSLEQRAEYEAMYANLLAERDREVTTRKRLEQNQQYQDYQAEGQRRIALAAEVAEAEILWEREITAQKAALFKQQVAALRASNRDRYNQMVAAGGGPGNETKPTGQSFVSSFANQASALATGMVIFEVFAGIQNSIRGSVTAAHDLIQSIGEIRTISQQNQQTTAEWREEVVRLSNTYGHDLKDVSEGLYQTLSNQIASGADTEGFMRDAMDFAVTTKSTTTEAVNLLSSGIKGFGLSLEETRPLAASFFKLIELGRVRAGEMADTFGTTAPLAHQLGLSYNDLNATYAAMTIQGVKFNNAATFTRNMMLALLKPSKDMKAQFDEWNVASGQAAISTYGWLGLIEKFQAVVDRGGLTELAADFKNIRGLQGAALTSGPGFEELKKDYAQFGGTGMMSGYNTAIDETMKNEARKWDIEWQKVKNSFLSFGVSVIETTAKLAESLGGLSNIINQLKGALIALGVAWAGFRLIMASSESAMSVFNFGVNKLFTGIEFKV